MVLEDRLPNGLRLAAEAVPSARSAAFAILVPCGASTDPPGASGVAAILEEWLPRGAGDLDARGLAEAMDAIGLERDVEAGTEAIVVSGACLARDLPRALDLAAEIVRRPRLADEEFEACRDLALQAIDSLEDSPADLCMVELGRRFLPPPLDRSPYGEAGEIRAASAAAVRESARARLGPRGACVAVAGAVDPAEAARLVRDRFAGWEGGAEAPAPAGAPRAGRAHLERPGAQVQIGAAWPSVPLESPESDLAQCAATILSGGMGARLFTEVREKRGLVYAVKAAYRAHRGLGFFSAYAGTTPERAAETERVLLGEVERLAEGVTDEELARAKVQARSSLVMQGESPRARAQALAGDLFRRGRPRGLDEALAAIEAITRPALDAFLAARPPVFTVVTLGPRPAA